MKMKLLSAACLTAVSLSAHALTPGSGTWVKESATYGTPNLQDAYVYVPANANPSVLAGKRALMLTLHGCGQTASGHVTNTKYNWEASAEKYGMVVVAPTVPSGTSSTRSVNGCWDWFGTGWTRNNRDQVPLKKLIDSVMSRSNLDIDPAQVYVTGLSSGAGETHVLGCVFPDVFAGVGVNAGPALGSASTDIFSDPKITAQQVASNCRAGNGNAYNAHFQTQVWNTIYGSNDSMVKPTHNLRNADGMCVLYGMTSGSACTGGEAITVAGGGSGNQYRDANGKLRVSAIAVSGMGHAWPAGSGGSGGGQYVDYTHVNYPVWISDWFFKNNLRIVTIPAPAGVAVGSATDNSLTVSWSAVSGAASYNVYRDGAKVGSATGTSHVDNGLKPGSTYNYRVTAVANGSESPPSTSVQGTTTGTPLPLDPPMGLSGTPAITSVALSWNAVSGAKSYNVYRNGNLVGNATTSSYTDSGLTASTTYNYAIATVNSANVVGAQGGAVAVTTKPNWVCTTTTDNNYNHVKAGRATQNLGYAYAVGSNQKMGLYNTYQTTTLAQTAAGYYAIGSCPQ